MRAGYVAASVQIGSRPDDFSTVKKLHVLHIIIILHSLACTHGIATSTGRVHMAKVEPLPRTVSSAAVACCPVHPKSDTSVGAS